MITKFSFDGTSGGGPEVNRGIETPVSLPEQVLRETRPYKVAEATGGLFLKAVKKIFGKHPHDVPPEDLAALRTVSEVAVAPPAETPVIKTADWNVAQGQEREPMLSGEPLPKSAVKGVAQSVLGEYANQQQEAKKWFGLKHFFSPTDHIASYRKAAVEGLVSNEDVQAYVKNLIRRNQPQ